MTSRYACKLWKKFTGTHKPNRNIPLKVTELLKSANHRKSSKWKTQTLCLKHPFGVKFDQIKVLSIKMAKSYKTKNRKCFRETSYILFDKLLECFLHCVKWQDKVSVLGYVVVQLHFWHLSFNSSFSFSPIGRSGSLLNTVRPVTGAHQRRPCRGCWCCCRCCPGTCRPLGPDERDRRRRWTLCWSALLRASTSLGLRHSASG